MSGFWRIIRPYCSPFDMGAIDQTIGGKEHCDTIRDSFYVRNKNQQHIFENDKWPLKMLG